MNCLQIVSTQTLSSKTQEQINSLHLNYLSQMTGLNCQLPLPFPLSPSQIPAWRTVKDKRALSLWHKLFGGWMPSRICAILDIEFRLRRVSSGVCQAVWIKIVLKLHHWNIFRLPVQRYRQVTCSSMQVVWSLTISIYFTFFLLFWQRL